MLVSQLELGAEDSLSLDRERHPALEWAASGAMALTGFSDKPPLLAPGPLASVANGAMLAFVAVARGLPRARMSELQTIAGHALLGERAAIAKLSRRGTVSPGGACHLLRCQDGWIAVNLARADDVALLPAWLEDGGFDPRASLASAREAVERAVRTRSVGALVERAAMLGLPVAEAAESVAPPDSPIRIAARGARSERRRDAAPVVVDLSALWAGPLCAHLLELAGARVIKIESTRRPDGARRGPVEFYDLLNAGKESVALDFESLEGRRALGAFIERADIVVESSRSRALAALGLDAREFVERTPGLVWASITGYGLRPPDCDRVAFGDAAGAAAGLAMALAAQTDGVPVFCGDAIADPLAGLHAAVAALASWHSGEARLVEITLRDVAAHASAFRSAEDDSEAGARCVSRADGAFEVVVGDQRGLVRPPRARRPAAQARALGADTASALSELARERC